MIAAGFGAMLHTRVPADPSMDYSTGKFSFIFIIAVAFAFCGAWWIAHRYRSAMRALMSSPTGAAAAVQPAALPDRAPPPVAISAAENRRAGWRLALLLVALSGLMALTSAGLLLGLMMEAGTLSIKRMLTLAMVHVWPVVPALALMWRWSRLRLLAVLLLWCLLCFFVILWRSIEPRPLEVLVYLASEIGLPLVLVAALCLGNATRAIAPWLLPPFIGLVWASVAGIDLLDTLVQRRSAWLMSLPNWLGAEVVMVLFAVLPWLLAWWPLKWLGHALARAYAAKQLSELMVLFTAVWGVALLAHALSAASSNGLAGAAMLLPLLWIAPVMLLNRRLGAARGRPPTLLVLRVFQHDARVQTLFDDVIERWRLTGNTVLIAGTDLVERTLDADDIFTFIDGRLPTRFIRSPADIVPRLAAFDLTRDAEGRYRINECYCHDTTWQDALAALVQSSDVVLMDLRSFQAHNAGCRHELNALAHAPRIGRVVVLTDGHTDLAVAQAEAAGAPAGRFVWLDISSIDRAKRRQVLESLFVAAAPGPANSAALLHPQGKLGPTR